MRGSSLGYLIKEGAHNIIANRLMSVASIGVLMACLLLVGSSVLFTMNINNLVGFVEGQNEVVVFLADGMEEDFCETMEQKLDSMENVRSYTYVSKEQGLEEWISSMDNTGGLFDGLYSDNILPDSYRIVVRDLSQLQETVDELDSISGVDSVSAPMEVAQTVTSLKQAVTVGGTSIVVILMVVAAVIIANTIKITVFNRRKEISIMKFVGATDSFIRMPFIVEGLLLGLISAVLAFLLLWGGYSMLISWLGQNPVGWIKQILDHMVVFKEIAFRLLGGFALAGVSLGTVGSMIFVRKYLKV